jgi:hypothetical protein
MGVRWVSLARLNLVTGVSEAAESRDLELQRIAGVFDIGAGSYPA